MIKRQLGCLTIRHACGTDDCRRRGGESAADLGAKEDTIKLAINEWTGQHVTTAYRRPNYPEDGLHGRIRHR